MRVLTRPWFALSSPSGLARSTLTCACPAGLVYPSSCSQSAVWRKHWSGARESLGGAAGERAHSAEQWRIGESVCPHAVDTGLAGFGNKPFRATGVLRNNAKLFGLKPHISAFPMALMFCTECFETVEWTYAEIIWLLNWSLHFSIFFLFIYS